MASRHVVARQVKRLIDGFPDTPPKTYAAMMVEEIMAVANPTEEVLTAACQHFLDKWRHLPTIADMLEELAVQERLNMAKRMIARVRSHHT